MYLKNIYENLPKNIVVKFEITDFENIVLAKNTLKVRKVITHNK